MLHLRRTVARNWNAIIADHKTSNGRIFFRNFAEKVIKTPFMADSITQGTLASWEKKIGEWVKQDETVANIETDKVTIPVNCPEAGLLTEQFASIGDTVQVGADLFKLDPDKTPPSSNTNTTTSESNKSSSNTQKTDTKKSNDPLSVKEPLRPPIQSLFLEAEQPPTPQQPPRNQSSSFSSAKATITVVGEKREKMTRMRSRIAERMKESQNVAASLTTFNEVDMSALIELRNRYKDDFLKKHGVKLGFMSPFVKAAASVLEEIPIVNARLDNTSQEIVYHDHVDISVAVATPKGLVTPVLRNCQTMSMLEIERTIAELGERARDNKISIEELSGGTFTISNGGVFGSMMGTPIINVPQAAILGMHAIKERPIVVEGGKIEARPMMYVALTYDHRLVDGREAVTFLVRLKQLLEDPTRFLINL